MSRRQRILRYVRQHDRGIEIGPWLHPLAPKRQGYDVLVLDIFGTEELRRRAKADAANDESMLARLEPVDLVGSANDIAEIVAAQTPPLGSFDYIVSSHNFEHIPNPVHFLQGCERVLRVGGILSFAVPDRRTCFDYFNPHSLTADFLEAFFARQTRPTPKQVFRMQSLHAQFERPDGSRCGGFKLSDDTRHVQALQTVDEAYQAWAAHEKNPEQDYRDVHCWFFTPASLELILRDLHYLGLIKFEIMEVSPTRGHEFFVHLRNRRESQLVPRCEFYEKRNRLLHRILDETSANARCAFEKRRGVLSTIDGREVFASLRNAMRGIRNALGRIAGGRRRDVAS